MYGGNTTKSDDDYVLLDRLLDRTRVSMNRVPQRGEVTFNDPTAQG